MTQPLPHIAPDFTQHIEGVRAVQALAQGNATPTQQREALEFIVERLAGMYEMSYVPGDANATMFAEGCRRVGQLIRSCLNLSLGTLVAAKKEMDQQNLVPEYNSDEAPDMERPIITKKEPVKKTVTRKDVKVNRKPVK